MLSRLLKSSPRAPFCNRHNAVDSSHSIDDITKGIDTTQVVLSEVEVLENMLKIPPLDIILKDDFLRSLAIKWFHHFQKEFEMHRSQSRIPCKPTDPFQLMHLPRVYQDLLQRWFNCSFLASCRMSTIEF